LERPNTIFIFRKKNSIPNNILDRDGQNASELKEDNKKKPTREKEKKGGSDTEFMKHMMTFIQQISSLACDSH